MVASIISAIVTGVLAAIVTGLFTKNVADKKHSVENITQERKKWRDEMREAVRAVRCLTEHGKHQETKDISFESFGEARAFFVTRLNLGDPEDRKILKILDNISSCQEQNNDEERPCIHCNAKGYYKANEDDDKSLYCLICQFENAISCMLKHDWDRAKNEIKTPQLSLKIGLICMFLFVVIACCQNELVRFLQEFFSSCLTVCVTILFVKKILFVIAGVLVSWSILRGLLGKSFMEFFKYKGDQGFCKILSIPFRMKSSDIEPQNDDSDFCSIVFMPCFLVAAVIFFILAYLCGVKICLC